MRVIEHILATRVIGVSLFQAFVTWGAPRKTAVENNFFWGGGGYQAPHSSILTFYLGVYRAMLQLTKRPISAASKDFQYRDHEQNTVTLASARTQTALAG